MFFSCGRGNTSEMSANTCFSMRNKTKPKKKRKRNEAIVTEKKERKKKEQEQHFSVALSSLFFKIIIARLRREETGFYSSYAGSTTKWRQKFRSNILYILYACLQIFPSFDRILSMFVDFSTFRSLVDFFMLRRIECFQEKAIF